VSSEVVRRDGLRITDSLGSCPGRPISQLVSIELDCPWGQPAGFSIDDEGLNILLQMPLRLTESVGPVECARNKNPLSTTTGRKGILVPYRLGDEDSNLGLLIQSQSCPRLPATTTYGSFAVIDYYW
jgi:hypothetical protein